MFNDHDTAKKVNDLMVEYQKKLSDSMLIVRENCQTDEIQQYRLAVGKVLAGMILNIMSPIYEKHPDLKPKELDK